MALALALAVATAACGESPLQPSLGGRTEIVPALNAASGVSLPMVDAGLHHSCAVTADGGVVCWGSNAHGQTAAPSGSYTQVSAGYLHSCALAADGSIDCWGWNERAQATPPAGAFVQVSAGVEHSCALAANGEVTCWGMNYYGQVGGSITTTTAPFTATVTHEGPFVQVSAGLYHTCAITAEGAALCWGRNDVGATTPAAGTYTQVSAAWYYSCGLRTDGTVACWGNNGNLQATPPAGTFTQVSAGAYHTCALADAGDVTCWGFDGWGAVSGEGANENRAHSHDGPFTHVDAGIYHSCAAKADGSLACWGAGTTDTGIEPDHGQAIPPVLTVPQTIAFTSGPPSPAILGGSYTVTATGGGSGSPVIFTSLTPAVCAVEPSADGAATVRLVAVGGCTVAADQAGSASHLPAPRVTQSVAVVFDFGGSTGGGFAAPVSSTSSNAARAGQAVPIKFDLGGDHGLLVVASGYPRSAAAACPSGSEPVNVVPEETQTAGGSALTYDAATGLYGYVWKTDKAWAGSCREFVLKLVDGTEHRASFRFTR